MNSLRGELEECRQDSERLRLEYKSVCKQLTLYKKALEKCREQRDSKIDLEIDYLEDSIKYYNRSIDRILRGSDEV